MHTILLPLLSACSMLEGPIDVFLVDIPEDEATLEWRAVDDDTWTVCENLTTDATAVVGCGPVEVEQTADYAVRVTWQDVEVEQVTTVTPRTGTAATAQLTFSAADFTVDGD